MHLIDGYRYRFGQFRTAVRSGATAGTLSCTFTPVAAFDFELLFDPAPRPFTPVTFEPLFDPAPRPFAPVAFEPLFDPAPRPFAPVAAFAFEPPFNSARLLVFFSLDLFFIFVSTTTILHYLLVLISYS